MKTINKNILAFCIGSILGFLVASFSVMGLFVPYQNDFAIISSDVLILPAQLIGKIINVFDLCGDASGFFACYGLWALVTVICYAVAFGVVFVFLYNAFLYFRQRGKRKI